MNKKYIYTLIGILPILFVLLTFKNRLSLLSINNQQAAVNSEIKDISNQFIITPDQEYSLRNKDIIIPPSTLNAPQIPERIEIRLKVNNSFSEPLWAKGKDCNYNGVLEKKTYTGWVVADEEICQDEKSSIPGRFFNNGYDELNYVIFTENAEGIYRARHNLLYGCKTSKDTDGNIAYSNCDGEVVLYSPTFKIVK